MGPLLLSDLTHQTVDELYLEEKINGPVKNLNDGLINGTNAHATAINGLGSRFTMKVDEGKSYRLRIVNPVIDTHWQFGIDNHTMTVISMDFVPTKPYTTDQISMGMGSFVALSSPYLVPLGQRYDVIITAKKSSVADSFWMLPKQHYKQH